MADPAQKSAPLTRVIVDYAPLLVFFAVNFLTPGPTLVKVITATIAFMIAEIAALLFSLIRLGSISPMLWITGVLVLVFGGLTIYFHDQQFIQMKPTFVYALLGGILLFGLITRRPLLQMLLSAAYPGLDAEGWRKVTRNWAVFFLLMAVANEAVWRGTLALWGKDAGWNAWLWYKFPGCAILSVIFALANIPMLMKHGLNLGDEQAPEVPPEG
ncbi:inner membrane-spanning protein YciB [Sphingomonas immobilis]|uniref:Inner membrane-spanning protein YciB n=1 Tax=Sphingomonas immobilis TaxID=3063997 RepID=A0ABT8ZZV1_9SPHN|nr:septation protein IspZ [Sphingomonas sp. CA1-15]MDO7842808.1 septation protein IspZ [Sphingomonas sp. CA1-15]